MKFKKFMKAIRFINDELPIETTLPSKEWFKTNIAKKDRKGYLDVAIEQLSVLKSIEDLKQDNGYKEPDETSNEEPEQPTGIDATLTERGSNYGKFENQANLSQKLQVAFEQHVLKYGQPENYTNSMNEAIQLIFHKLSRIANGSPMYIENFRDICGYAQLVVNELETTEGATDAKVTKITKENGEWV